MRWGVLLVGLFACAPEMPANDASTTSKSAKRYRLSDEEIETLIGTTSTARQIAVSRPVTIRRVDRKSFLAQLFGDTNQAEETSTVLAFNLLPPPSERKKVPSMKEVLSEQVLGFFDPQEDAIFIVDQTFETEQQLAHHRAVLSHEIEHALQAQRFPRPAKPKTTDEALAQLAVFEGDAMVAMGAVIGFDAGAPVGRTLRQIVEVTKRVPLGRVTSEKGKLDRSLPITQRNLEFPYVDGMTFVADVYRAGGFPLVDQVFAAPPVATTHVLHPEKFLAGFKPRSISDPDYPKHTLVNVDTLGELDMQLVLARCLEDKTAKSVAAGWAGDRFGVFDGPDGIALTWVIAFETEQDAKEAEAALQKSSACWTANEIDTGKGKLTIGPGFDVAREGKVVGFLRNVPTADRAASFKRLFARIGPEQPASPLTTLKIPAAVPLPAPQKGGLVDDVHQNDWLGIVGRVPRGMTGKAGGELDLVITREGEPVFGGMTFSTRVTSDEQVDRTFEETRAAFETAIKKASVHLQLRGNARIQTALGAGVERSWTWGNAVFDMVLVPICAGTGSVVFLRLFGDARSAQVLKGWMESYRWLDGRNLRACDYLDPK